MSSQDPEHHDGAAAADAPAADAPAAAIPAQDTPAQDTRAQDTPAPSGARVPPAPRRGAVLRDALHNLGVAAALVLLQRRPPEALRSSATQLVLLFVLALLLGFAYDLYAVGWHEGHLETLSLPAVSFWALAILFASWLAAALGARRDLALALAVAGFALACWESAAAYLLAMAADASPAIDRLYAPLSWLPLGWVAAAFGLACARMMPGAARRRRGAIFVLAAALAAAPQWCANPAARLWSPAADLAQGATGAGSAQSEQALYGQLDQLDDALDAVAPGDPGVTELFTITFGGDGTQDVFLNEAVGADAVLADAFGSDERGIVLANSVARPQEHPFATASALQRALATMAERMNPDEDVLALVLSSHGGTDHRLAVALPPYEFDDLTPERLRELLDEAGIRYRIVIVSACYSGAFVDALAGNDTMVITAAATDRASFGCRDGAQWTEFGQAYFAEALAQTASFEGAFRLASQRIAAREAKQGLAASQPQISVGAGIRDQLQRLETRRGGHILFARGTGRRRDAVADL